MDFNEEIIRLWETHSDDLSKWYKDKEILAPMLYPELSKKSLLTIGINPSFSETGFQSLTKKDPISDLWNHYSFKNRNQNAKKWVEFESTARSEYSYYKRFRELDAALNIGWNHIDLYYIRATKQKEFLKDLSTYQNLKNAQIELTKKIITSLQPRMILVANVKAVPEYQTFFDEQYEWCEEQGCYFTTIYKQNIPTHFSGQLKYIDRESFKRLKWIMKRSLTKRVDSARAKCVGVYV